MQDIAELERRITFAIERIGKGIDAAAPREAAGGGDGAETVGLRAALEEKRVANAQLSERLKALKARDAEKLAVLEARVEQLTRLLDQQGIETQRIRASAVQLREHLRVVTEAQLAGFAEPHLVNRAMLLEIESLRVARQSELAELDEILAGLSPLIEEVRRNA